MDRRIAGFWSTDHWYVGCGLIDNRSGVVGESVGRRIVEVEMRRRWGYRVYRGKQRMKGVISGVSIGKWW